MGLPTDNLSGFQSTFHQNCQTMSPSAARNNNHFWAIIEELLNAILGLFSEENFAAKLQRIRQPAQDEELTAIEHSDIASRDGTVKAVEQLATPLVSVRKRSTSDSNLANLTLTDRSPVTIDDLDLTPSQWIAAAD
jgi:hypothetical protein